jgi:imidazolonepropionase-like amidohydrolase
MPHVKNLTRILLTCTLILGLPALAEEFSPPVAITGITAVTSPGESLENATILIEDGRIREVGTSVIIPDNAEIINGTGLFAYAGFIDAATHMGIADKRPDDETLKQLLDDEFPVIEGPRTSMQKANRMGVWPHLGAEYFYKHDKKTIDKHRKAGFTAALVTPYADILSGYGDVLQLNGSPLRSATLAHRVTQIAGFGDFSNVSYSKGRTYPSSPMGAVALLRQTYMDAEWYRQRHALFEQHPNDVERPEFDPVLDAMGLLLDRKEVWIAAVDTPNEIHHALNLAHELNQRIAILGGKEAWKVADRLAAENVPVIVSLDFPEKPKRTPDEPKDETPGQYTTVSWTPAWENEFFEPLALRDERIREWEEQVNNLQVLADAGVTVAVSTADLKNPEELFKNAEKALKLNLTTDTLLTALTTGPATVLGLSGQLGSIAPGKLANLTLLTQPLGEKDAHVRHVYVDGERFSYNVNGAKDKDDEKEGADEESDDGDDSKADNVAKEDDEPQDLYVWDYETAADRAQPLETGGNLLLQNATVLTVTNGIKSDTDVLVVNGKIRELGKDLTAPDGTTTIDLKGYWVSPGIIDPHSHIAVTGVNEWTQSISSEVRQADVVNHTSLSIHRALAGGVTTIHTMHGSANSMGGQNAVLKLKYNTSPQEMLVTSGPRIVKFALGENVTRARPIPRFPNSRMGVESVMRQAFDAALEYQKDWQRYTDTLARGEITDIPRRDLRLEALSDILAGRIWVHSHCYRGDEMLRLLQVAQDYGFRIGTLQHVLEGYRVAPEMFAHGVGGSTFSDWWSYKKEAFDAIPYNAAMMVRAGIVTSLNSDSGEVIRHLNLEAGKTMRYGGLTADEAMRLITINPAIQIGLDNRAGSIEVGKDGDFAVFTRHPLNTHTRNVMTIVEGEIFFAEDGLNLPNPASGPGDASVPVPPGELLDIPVGSGAQQYVIQGATVHPVTSAPISDGAVIIANGKIEAVGKDIAVPEGATIIDGTGLHVYPGLIDAATQMGLSEISGLAQTVDSRDLATYQPELRTLSGINPHSEHIPVTMCEGITLSHVLPLGGIISGRGSAIQMSGWTTPELLRSNETGLVIDLPVLPVELDKEKRQERIDGQQKKMEATEAFIRRAQLYAKSRPGKSEPGHSLRLEAMIPYVTGEKPVFFRANTYKEIRSALRFAEAFQLKAVILGGADAWKCADTLAEKDIPVIVTQIFRIPASPHERYDAYYKNPAKLEQAGVLFAIASTGTEFARQLAARAGYAVAYGLSPESAVQSITINGARILRLDSQVGSLEAGKTADIIITSGDPTQASTRTLGMFINGAPVKLTSRHERNYEKFSNRPDPGLATVDDLRGPHAMRTR